MNEEEFLESVNPQEGDQQEVEQEALQDNVQEEVQDQQADPEILTVEQIGRNQGWVPLEEYDGDPANWKSAENYIQYGELLTQIKKRDQRMDQIEANHREDISNQNKLHELRRAKELDSLKAKQRQSVENEDLDAYDTTQREIDELQAEATPAVKDQAPQVDPLVTDWVSKNPWINDPNDDRSAVAMGALHLFQQSNPDASVPDAIAHVEGKVNKLFPPENPRRNQPSTTETGRRPAQRTNRDLTMSDLTSEEKSEWDTLGLAVFKNDEKAFLKAVKNTRTK